MWIYFKYEQKCYHVTVIRFPGWHMYPNSENVQVTYSEQKKKFKPKSNKYFVILNFAFKPASVFIGPRYTHLLSGETWPEVDFMEELQPKKPYSTSDMETWTSMHKNSGTEKCQQVSPSLKYLPVAEGSLFMERLESSTVQ